MAFKKGLHRFSFVTMFFIWVHTFRNNDIQTESSFILISKNQTLNIKAPLSDVEQFLVTESPVQWWEWCTMMRMMYNDENDVQWWEWCTMMRMMYNDENDVQWWEALFLFFRCLDFCSDFFYYVEKATW